METLESFWLIEGSDPEMLLILCALFLPSIVGVSLAALIALWLPDDDAASESNVAEEGRGAALLAATV